MEEKVLTNGSTTFEKDKKISLIPSGAEVNADSYAALRSMACVDEIVNNPGTKAELSNSEKSRRPIESDINLRNRASSFEDPIVPKHLSVSLEGMRVCGDTRVSLDSKPSWLDVDKYRAGQKVALKYFFGIQFAQLLSLFVVVNIPGGTEPLIFTGKSDTPFKAFKRYLSTALRIRSWFLDDLWDPKSEGYRNLKTVRTMHEALRKNLEATDPKERDRKSTLSGRSESGCPAIWSTLNEVLIEDFKGICPKSTLYENELTKSYKSRVFVSQAEMCIIQFAFVGLFIKYPAYFGAHYITNEELDSFVHLWRCIGYLLGIEDKYNFCNGDLQTVLQKTTDIIEYICKPNLRKVTQEWEHMIRCLIEGTSYYVGNITFETSLLYLCDMFGLQTPKLWAALTFRQKIEYYLTKFIFWFLLRLPGALNFHNYIIERSLKRGENATPSQLKEWKERKYPYQKSTKCN